MPVSPQFTARSGASQFMKFAQVMCRLTNVAASTIRARYPDRPALLLVLLAAEDVCGLLPAAMAEQVEMDAPSVTFDPADTELLPGQHT